jgi:ADP-ribose pyrophosphatase YjhB (NUDIX family)
MPEGIHYCVRCGGPVQLEIRFGAQRPVCPQCGWIYFADPKVAAAVLVEQDGQVLLVQRSNDPQAGLWSLPAGFVDAWEDPARAAERECLEETGLVVKVTNLLDVIAGREHPQGADMVIAYRAEIVGGRLAAGDDARQAIFFPRAELPPLAFKATKRVLDL